MECVYQIFQNGAIVASAISWFIAQLIKLILCYLNTKRVNIKLLTSSGGMPSSHSAFVVALSTYIGLTEGFDSTYFAICFVICMVVTYDAANVRREAGRHAVHINKILEQVKTLDSVKLKEALGHSPVEVFIGGLLGFVVAIITYIVLN